MFACVAHTSFHARRSRTANKRLVRVVKRIWLALFSVASVFLLASAECQVQMQNWPAFYSFCFFNVISSSFGVFLLLFFFCHAIQLIRLRVCDSWLFRAQFTRVRNTTAAEFTKWIERNIRCYGTVIMGLGKSVDRSIQLSDSFIEYIYWIRRSRLRRQIEKWSVLEEMIPCSWWLLDINGIIMPVEWWLLDSECICR